jgi:hypothetical protein
MCANLCSRKLLVVDKKSENIEPGSAELAKKKGGGVSNLSCLVPICPQG